MFLLEEGVEERSNESKGRVELEQMTCEVTRTKGKQHCCDSTAYWVQCRGPLDTSETSHNHSINCLCVLGLVGCWQKSEEWLCLRHAWGQQRVGACQSRSWRSKALWSSALTNMPGKWGGMGQTETQGPTLGHYTSPWHYTETVLHFLICRCVGKECESFGARLGCSICTRHGDPLQESRELKIRREKQQAWVHTAKRVYRQNRK